MLLAAFAIPTYLVTVGCVLETLDLLSDYCRYDVRYRSQISPHLLIILISEFLVHAADVEGLCQGIDEELVASVSAP